MAVFIAGLFVFFGLLRVATAIDGVAYRLAAQPASVSPGTDESSGEGVKQTSLNHEELVKRLVATYARDDHSNGEFKGDCVNPDGPEAAALILQQSAALARKDAALRRIAEGNLGTQPWQAGFDAIREVARQALETKDGGAS